MKTCCDRLSRQRIAGRQRCRLALSPGLEQCDRRLPAGSARPLFHHFFSGEMKLRARPGGLPGVIAAYDCELVPEPGA